MKKSAVSTRTNQRGVTLFELIVSAIILGVVSWITAANMGSFMAAKQQTFNAEQTVINRKIAQAMMNWSEYADIANGTGSVVRGTLPQLCTSGAEEYETIVVEGICNDSLGQYLIAAGVDNNSVHFSSPLDKRLRIYQKLRPSQGVPSITVGLMGSYGASVQLNYDLGLIYTTNCRPTEACYTTASGKLDLGLGDPSPAPSTILQMQSGGSGTSNLAQWTPPKNGVAGVTYVSTLPLQKKLLAITTERLTKIRDSLQTYFLTKQSQASTATKYSTNFYPNDDADTSNFPNALIPESGCRRAWINLSDPNSKVLQKIGVSTGVVGAISSPAMNIEGLTAWGGTIQYCSDYDPGGDSPSRDAAPHVAALRVFTSVTVGAPPSGTSEDNTYVIF